MVTILHMVAQNAQFEVSANTNGCPRSAEQVASGMSPTATKISVVSVGSGLFFEWDEDFLGEDLNQAIRLCANGAVIVEARQLDIHTSAGREKITHTALKRFESPLLSFD